MKLGEDISPPVIVGRLLTVGLLVPLLSCGGGGGVDFLLLLLSCGGAVALLLLLLLVLLPPTEEDLNSFGGTAAKSGGSGLSLANTEEENKIMYVTSVAEPAPSFAYKSKK